MRSCAVDFSAAELTVVAARRRECAGTSLRVARWLWLSILMLPTSLLAAAPPAGSQVVHAWSRATAPGASVGVAYLEILNSGDQDTLIRIESPIARQAQMHSVLTIGGVMKMRELLSVDIPARGYVRFEPGGSRIMLVDLLQPLKQGDRFPMTLVFQHAGSVHVEVIVQDVGATTPLGELGNESDHHP